MRILVVDDEKIKRVTLSDDLATQGYEVEMAGDGQEAIDKLTAASFDVVVTDLKMPNVDGIELLKWIKQGPLADVAVVMMTAYGSIEVAVEAVKLGAFDFVTKPFRNDDIFPLLARIERERKEKAKAEAPAEVDVANEAPITDSIITESPSMERVIRMIEVAARTDANVLLCGETGVGKDLISSVIHRHSHRSGFPYVKVGCTLFPPQLIESELYGHEKGSFTGAESKRKGRFDLAQGGTLYLDDVDDIPLEQQSKLLRAIEEKVFEKVGGTTQIQADVRFIASTKQNLLDKIDDGSFRRDLYYRLDVLRINIPPLRDRLDDLPLLVDHLMRRIAKEQPYEIDSDAVDVLLRHDWPGNIRELYHTLERAWLVGADHITASLLTAEMAGIAAKKKPATGGFRAAMDHAERELLADALAAAGGNKTAAAESLGMKASTFRDKLGKHGLG